MVATTFLNNSFKIIVSFVLLCCIFSISCVSDTKDPQANENKKSITNKIDRDTIGILITQLEFTNTITTLITELSDSNYIRDSSFYIKFIRVINTIEKNNWFDNYGQVRKLFYDRVYKEAIIKLNGNIYKGGAIYCQDYDLFIGGPPHVNSQYHIVK